MPSGNGPAERRNLGVPGSVHGIVSTGRGRGLVGSSECRALAGGCGRGVAVDGDWWSSVDGDGGELWVPTVWAVQGKGRRTGTRAWGADRTWLCVDGDVLGAERSAGGGRGRGALIALGAERSREDTVVDGLTMVQGRVGSSGCRAFTDSSVCGRTGVERLREDVAVNEDGCAERSRADDHAGTVAARGASVRRRTVVDWHGVFAVGRGRGRGRAEVPSVRGGTGGRLWAPSLAHRVAVLAGLRCGR
ncbi:unnamed protein product [Symbiodinium microadriaticum]|nr:unnamed protein product [Symbiodinium microadriaticum]